MLYDRRDVLAQEEQLRTPQERVVTERKCGGVEDVTGCTLYNSKISRKVRHLISKEPSTGTVRRETSTLFVEVCSESCPGGECVSEAPKTSAVTVALILLLTLYLR
nr:Protein T02E1.8, isoform b [Haemonchus contortus]